jgi:hypothetical protein
MKKLLIISLFITGQVFGADVIVSDSSPAAVPSYSINAGDDCIPQYGANICKPADLNDIDSHHWCDPDPSQCVPAFKAGASCEGHPHECGSLANCQDGTCVNKWDQDEVVEHNKIHGADEQADEAYYRENQKMIDSYIGSHSVKPGAACSQDVNRINVCQSPSFDQHHWCDPLQGRCMLSPETGKKCTGNGPFECNEMSKCENSVCTVKEEYKTQYAQMKLIAASQKIFANLTLNDFAQMQAALMPAISLILTNVDFNKDVDQVAAGVEEIATVFGSELVVSAELGAKIAAVLPQIKAVSDNGLPVDLSFMMADLPGEQQMEQILKAALKGFTNGFAKSKSGSSVASVASISNTVVSNTTGSKLSVSATQAVAAAAAVAAV